MKIDFLKTGLALILALGLASVPALAAGKPTKAHDAKTHAQKDRTDQQHDHGAKDGDEKDKCAEMMEHNKAPTGESADASKKGCGMMMGKKKGMKKG